MLWNIPATTWALGDLTILPRPQIVGGLEAQSGEFPAFALMVATSSDTDRRGRCGGALITPNKILTAAHCIVLREADTQYLMVPGFYNQSSEQQDLIGIGVAEIHTHPSFDEYALENDIAILTLQRTAVSPTAPIFVGNDQLVGRRSTVIGAGLIDNDNAILADTLKKFTTTLVSNETCNLHPDISQFFTSALICVPPPETPPSSACFGDSGSPLMITINGRSVIAGVASFLASNDDCATQNSFAGYTRTSSFIDFIKQHAPEARLIYSSNDVSLPPLLDLLLSAP
ncbi:S1 family peptidase [Arenicella xantha]|nr:serine protease [Arenicella xantha]